MAGPHARTRAQRVLEAVPEATVHPAIYHRVVAAVAHGEPVARDPHDLYVAVHPDLRVGVSHECDGVEGQPAQGVDDDHRDHHLDHLKRYKQTTSDAVQCSAVQYSTVQCSAVQCSAVQCSAVQCSAVQCSAVQCSTVQYSTVQYSTVQYSTVQYSTVQYSTVQYSTVQYSTVQYSKYIYQMHICII